MLCRLFILAFLLQAVNPNAAVLRGDGVVCYNTRMHIL